ncbi:uncharacterized protein LOC135117135, partial [Helicoverpa armigera]|uniref:uncharacterized protein LOC135117135 n=1 Tax=Helicoverpa armigera TaxID=29058 RepID=UPI003082FB91
TYLYRHFGPSTSCHQIVTPITTSPGLYFDKINNLKFTNDNWNVITYLDISRIHSHFTIVESLFSRVNTYCKDFSSSKIQQDCLNALSALQNQHDNNVKKYSSVSYLVNSNKRYKRGLIDAGGSLLKTFFGTLDAEDALKFSNAIDQVETDEKQLAHLMRDNIHVIKSTITTFNNSISKLNENEQRLNKNLEVIDKGLQLISNSNDKLEIKSNINSLLSALESITLVYSTFVAGIF